jgi:hypothetical protein
MSTSVRDDLRQRADYTHKPNLQSGRHGWLRLTPAYSVKVVEEIITSHPEAQRILDPFCGTATTALSAAYHGHEGVTTDINPFLVWLGQAKLATYTPTKIDAARKACVSALALVKRGVISPAPRPPIHNIERWWSEPALTFLCAIKTAIVAVTEPNSEERTLLHVSFCRTLISISNAAFNHQSMSFKDIGQAALLLDHDIPSMFAEDVRFVLNGAADNPPGSGSVLLGDSRNLSAVLDGKFDLVVTSPPYANRMSYIRELRPYMYWLDHLITGRDAGDLDWLAIGGTWGIATSRLTDWERSVGKLESPMLDKALYEISHADNKNGRILANYVAKYFDDMWLHFQDLVPSLAPNAKLHYIVGNSTFYGTLLSVELIYAEMLRTLGFSRIQCRAIRKRNSKKELIEFDVTARWRG